MSTFATADLGPSDDEGDADFVPPSGTTPQKRKAKRKAKSTPSRADSASASSSSGSDEEDDVDDAEVKRLKKDQEDSELEGRRRKAAEAFAAMKADSGGGGQHDTAKQEEEMVEVKRPRQFAGETIYETVSLPASDPEAIAYLSRIRNTGTSTSTAVNSSSSDHTPTPQSLAPTSSILGESSNNLTTQTASPPVPVSALKTPSKAPIRRKPRQSLEQMSAALDKGKKMTTLAKSAMDWKSHTASDTSMKDELEANRRAGGYLEKQNFLDRVGERRAGAFDGASGGRR